MVNHLKNKIVLNYQLKNYNKMKIAALINSIDFNLPKRDIQENSVLTKEEQITLDKVKQILKSRTSDNIYDSTVIESEVLGCTDPKTSNYNEPKQLTMVVVSIMKELKY